MADRYWVGGAGDWFNTSSWSTSSGGFSGASVPTSADNVFFDDNSRGIPAQQGFAVSFSSSTAYCNNLSIALTSGKNLNWNSPNNQFLTLEISGNLFVATEGTFFPTVLVNNTLGASLRFVGTGLSTVNLNTAKIRSLTISKSLAGYVALLNHIDVTATISTNYGFNEFILGSGNITLNGYTVTADLFNSSGSASRSITFSNGAIDLLFPTGGSPFITTIVNLTNSSGLTTDDTGYIRLNGAASAKVLLSNTATEAQALSFEIASNQTYEFSYNGSSTDSPVISSLKLTTGAVTTPAPATSGANPVLLSCGNIITGAGTINCGITLFSSTKNQTIDGTAGPLNGVANTWNVLPIFTVNKLNRSFTLLSSATLTNYDFILTNGTLDISGYTFAVRTFDSSNSNTRAITFNGGTLRVLYNGTSFSVVLFTITIDTNLTTDIETGLLHIDGYRGFVFLGGYDISKRINYFFATTVTVNSVSILTSASIYAFRNITTAGSFTFRRFGTGAGTKPIEFWGDLTLGGRFDLYTNLSGAPSITFKASGSITASSYSPSSANLFVLPPLIQEGGTRTLQSNINLIGISFELKDGTFDTNGYLFDTTLDFISTNTSGTRNLILGNSTWIVRETDGVVFDFNTTNMGTLSFGSNAKIQFAGNNPAVSKTVQIQGPSRTFPKIEQAGEASLDINANNMTFSGISSISVSGVFRPIRFQSGTTTLFDSFSLSGSSVSARQAIGATTSGSAASISMTTKDVDVNVSFCAISDSWANDTDTNWNAFSVNGNIDGGNNRGWRFSEIEGGAFMAFF